jgi:hypothetical protein
MKFEALCKSLEEKIQKSYEEGVTLEDAEKLAGEFLYAQIQVSSELKKSDLDSRMRKSGVKAIKAAIYSEACSKSDKKPTESALEHILNLNELVQGEQEALDNAEASRDELSRYYSIFQNAHIHFRGIAKGKFE